MENLKKLTAIMSEYFRNGEKFTNSKDAEFVLSQHLVAEDELGEIVGKMDREDKPDNLDRAARLILNYNPSRETLKKEYHRLARKELKKLAESLLAKEIVVDSNLAGPAVIGETTLMAMFEHGVGFSIVLAGDWAHARAIKSVKDYTGGRNREVPVGEFRVGDISKIAQSILEQFETEFQ